MARGYSNGCGMQLMLPISQRNEARPRLAAEQKRQKRLKHGWLLSWRQREYYSQLIGRHIQPKMAA